MIKDGEVYLMGTTKRDWCLAKYVMNGGIRFKNKAIEATYLTPKEVDSIFIIQHEGEYEDIAAILDIEESSARSLVSRVRGKRVRAENTIRAMVQDFGSIERVGHNAQPQRKVTPEDWRPYIESMGIDERIIELILETTYLSMKQTVFLVLMQNEVEFDEIARAMGIESPPSTPSVKPETVLLKRYIPMLRNNRRRCVNTLKFLESDFKFLEFDERYSVDNPKESWNTD